MRDRKTGCDSEEVLKAGERNQNEGSMVLNQRDSCPLPHNCEASREIRSTSREEVRNLILVLMVFMAVASVMVKLVDFQTNDTIGTLSLRGGAPPSDEPLFLIESTANARYLRSAVGIVYDGKTWRLEEVAGRYQSEHAVTDSEVKLPLCVTELSRGYSDYDRDVLNRCSLIADPRCLELADNIPERVRELSRRITADLSTPFEKAKAIETYLRVKHDYKLNYVPAPEDREPNDWFLFETKEGICGNFNSAFVILARASGIPSRLAAGYFVKPGKGRQVVYANQAHAWAEVGFDGIGWLAFEAVPP